ncbi:MAG: branched-chain amino acid ABC transporter permease [Leptolyngbyaceae bacterium]|nr:branched-chain amino acid ABC transporter permease [Leptolyngbyaceae bacterium]
MIEGLLSGLFNGISIGAVLLIVALGLAIVFGLMGVINLAHGELMMLGAYTTYVVQNGFKLMGESVQDYYIWAALPLSFIVAALVGFALERLVIRYLYGRPLETLLATWGVSLILIQYVRSVNTAMMAGIIIFCVAFWGGKVLLSRMGSHSLWRWGTTVLALLSGAIALVAGILLNKTGADFWAKPWFTARNVDVTAPAWLRGGISITSTFQLPSARLFIIALTVVCLIAIYWFLQKSIWGLRIRAVTQNRQMSACLGIPTGYVDALTFALGSGLAGIAGFAVTFLGSVGPNLGSNYIVDAFMVVVVGGVGKIVGSVVAAMVIGIITYLVGSGTLALIVTWQPLVDFFTFFATTSMAKVMVFVLIIAFLQVRPAGIFPQKGRMVDA